MSTNLFRPFLVLFDKYLLLHIDINILSFVKKTNQSANQIAWCSGRVFEEFFSPGYEL